MCSLMNKHLFNSWSAITKLQDSPCVLTSNDFSIIDNFIRDPHEATGTYSFLLRRLLRHKISHSRIVLPPDVPGDVATLSSRLVFSMEDSRNEVRRLIHSQNQAAANQTVSVFTLLGATLIGMSAGQTAPLLKADGSINNVTLRRVTQPSRIGVSRPGFSHPAPQTNNSRGNQRPAGGISGPPAKKGQVVKLMPRKTEKCKPTPPSGDQGPGAA